MFPGVSGTSVQLTHGFNRAVPNGYTTPLNRFNGFAYHKTVKTVLVKILSACPTLSH